MPYRQSPLYTKPKKNKKRIIEKTIQFFSIVLIISNTSIHNMAPENGGNVVELQQVLLTATVLS